MQSRRSGFKSCVLLSVLFLVCAGGTIVRAGQTCKDSAGNSPCQGTNTPCVCVERANLNPPEEGTDFAVDFSDTSSPDVTFYTGSSTYPWRVWSQEHATDTTPDNLGDLFIDSTGSTDNYKVELKNPNNGNPGAANLASAALFDETNWSGYSSITGGQISGSLSGPLTLVEDDQGAGGTLNLEIGGDASGIITAHQIAGGETFKIAGDASGDISVDILAGTLEIGGTLSGDVGVNTEIDGGLLEVKGAVGSTSQINIAAVTGGSPWTWNMRFNTSGYPGELDFAGDLSLGNGLPAGQGLQVYGRLTQTASIDFTGDDVAGDAEIGAAESGSTISAGNLVSPGLFTLALASAQSPFSANDFSGSLTFASVGAELSTESGAGNIGGIITITGDVSAQIGIGGPQQPGDNAGNLFAGGRIAVGGSLTGTGHIYVAKNDAGEISVTSNVATNGRIEIVDDMSGTVHVGGYLNGDIDVGGHVTTVGSISVEGSASGDILATGELAGDVTVVGEFDGNICAKNLTPGGLLPPNIDIADFGPNGRICGGCTGADDCADLDQNGIRDDNCVWWVCAAAFCEPTETSEPSDMGGSYGACPADGFCNLHDANLAMACFSQTTTCDSINIDAGGSYGACPPDGLCNVHDANHALSCFSATNTCTCGLDSDGGSEPNVVGQASVTIVPSQSVLLSGQTVAVRVFVDDSLDALQS